MVLDGATLSDDVKFLALTGMLRDFDSKYNKYQDEKSGVISSLARETKDKTLIADKIQQICLYNCSIISTKLV